MWLWIGGAVMLVGTVLAAFPGRRRSPIAPVSEPGAQGPAPVPVTPYGNRRPDREPAEVPT
jgi:cytochrome c-type biogenesis protein CcmF